ncbi:MAG TPA: hypothetical protein VGL83_18885 [Stellaceae bacterium]|jgi:hypothetical protein
MAQKTTAGQSVSTEDLTELALDAAIALDQQLHRTKSNEQTIQHFLETVGAIIEIKRDSAIGMLVPDPRKLGVVNRAFRYLNRANVSSVDELVESIKILAAGYREHSGVRENIVPLRDFCIALHRELLAHAHRSYEDPKRRDKAENAAKLL